MEIAIGCLAIERDLARRASLDCPVVTVVEESGVDALDDAC